ncbi:uncharacterized protein HRG_07468 [Hirsutella rhossiliensis]|uniref:DUF8035 domain-containing protein n=1 Tax=Hirsutella rhossiliensis TaxID=111463 RepID=A0A9P8MUB3_9HYPO|nr:uncharacterized protein HRG_07468 [Hirsutella rhossiliensis]KAH0961390.1 hypothetical protein HRG_07468 [Hirsutella rhossiliensis]
MSGSGSLQHIDAVDAFARTLFLRAQKHPARPLSDTALAVRQLHLALRHLRVEAADPDSLLNQGPDSTVYARQVQPIVQDCDFALKQLETVLDRYDASGGRHLDALADRVAAVRSRLENEKMSVDMLLDTVQLHNPAHAPSDHMLHGSDAGLERIKDKVDDIAARLFGRRDLGGTIGDEDRLWQEFKSELEKEGFSPQVLRQHKEVLRAYIRELETMSTLTGGAPPSVRGLLENHARNPGPPPVPPKERIHPSVFEEKSLLSVKSERRQPGHIPESPSQYEGHSFTSDDGTNARTHSMTLISTKDLMAMDSLQSGMAGLHLQPHVHAHRSSPRSTQKYLTSGATGRIDVASSHNPSASANSLLLGSSPGNPYNPSLQTASAPHSPSHALSTRSMPSRLAPDRYGKEIPMEAQWTRIRRTLVSPEVLERARVRYEARPDYVAVLGRLTREQIADYARQSAECRAARSGGHPPQRRHDRHQRRERADSKSSGDDEDDDSALWDESDSTDYDDDKTSFDKDSKSYPYIVNPPSKDKTSPASTVMPKPILKNKNENHVRFDPEPHEVKPKSARSFKDERDRREDHASRRPRDSRDREGSGRNRDGHRRDSERYSGERDRYSGDREERNIKKKAWGETLGAVGIGGAAASLLGVLAEAAVGGA